eukprot:gene10818-17712_t
MADELMSINAGGKRYEVLRSKLSAHGGMLAALAAGTLPVTKDSSGKPYIDVHPELFQY